MKSPSQNPKAVLLPTFDHGGYWCSISYRFEGPQLIMVYAWSKVPREWPLCEWPEWSEYLERCLNLLIERYGRETVLHSIGETKVLPANPDELRKLPVTYRTLTKAIFHAEAAIVPGSPDVAKNIDHLLKGHAYAFYRGHVCIGFGGISLSRQGVGQVWGTFNTEYFWATRAFRDLALSIIKEASRTMRLFRIQGDALSDSQHARWMRLLGFESEGIMRCAFPKGEDMARYSLVFSDQIPRVL